MPNLQLELILEFPDKLEVSKHGEETALAYVFVYGCVWCSEIFTWEWCGANWNYNMLKVWTCINNSVVVYHIPLYFQLFVWFWHDYVFADVCGLKICDSSVIITMPK